MRKVKSYGPYLLGFVLLVIISLFLPQVIFRMQDGYQLVGKSVESWDPSENGLISAEYEKDMYLRMINLIQKDMDELTISAISYGEKNADEVVNLLERVFESEWMGILNEMSLGMYYAFLQKTSTVNIQDCKKYVVYENTSLENILLMMWYLDIYMVDYDMRVRLLIDSETESVYFIKITGENAPDNVNSKGSKGANVQTYIDAKAKYEMTSVVPNYVGYYIGYYEAGMEDLYSIKEDGLEDGDVWYIAQKDSEGCSSISFIMPYGNISTAFEVCVTDGDNIIPDYSAGVTIIGNMVPEMIQD